MRIIAGTARSIQLKTPEGMDTRPTTDRIKETLFNILNPYLADCVFIDLFSGSGGIGLEAISRGAARAYLVDMDPKSIKCIEENTKKCHFEEQTVILKNDVFGALKTSIREHADIIFMDPPYHKDYEKKVLEILRESSIIDDETLIVIEASKDTDFSYLEDMGFDLAKEKVYKTNKHIFAYLKEQTES